MQTRLKLFTKWGISFGDPYVCPERAAGKVVYADRESIEEEINRRYQCLVDDDDASYDDEELWGGIQLVDEDKPTAAERLPPFLTDIAEALKGPMR